MYSFIGSKSSHREPWQGRAHSRPQRHSATLALEQYTPLRLAQSTASTVYSKADAACQALDIIIGKKPEKNAAAMTNHQTHAEYQAGTTH